METTVKTNIALDKELRSNFKKIGHFENTDFINNANRYLKAIREGRMMCVIDSVSASGMSRVMRFMEMDGTKKDGHRLYNFYAFFKALGYSEVKNGFRISGCGMDMVFATNYNIIHKLHRLGFINKQECDKLAQKTPHVL